MYPKMSCLEIAPLTMSTRMIFGLYQNAAYVLTDSFHCSAFSIQFHKQFMTFYRFVQGSATGRNSRIDSLFNILGVGQEHIYDGNVMNIESELDWNRIDTNFRTLKEESVDFLRKALS